jgi:type IV secretory pathway VirB9-like protein
MKPFLVTAALVLATLDARASPGAIATLTTSEPLQLVCAPLTACAVQLAPGETLRSTVIGDSARWLVKSVDPGSDRPLLVVKPSECGLRTNLIVTTDLRLLQLPLESPRCSDPLTDTPPPPSILELPAPPSAQLVTSWSAATAATASPAASRRSAYSAYQVSGGARKLRRSLRIWDDQTRLYVQIPAETAAALPAPLLLAEKPKSAADVAGVPVIPFNYSPEGLLQTDSLPRLPHLWLVLGPHVIRIEPLR